MTLLLTPDNCRQVLDKVCCALVAQNVSQWMWESLLGSLQNLNYAAQVLLLGRIHHRLTYEGIHLF